MTRLVRFGFVAALCGVVGVSAASCSIDKSAFTFDDDEFARLNGDGDDGTGGRDSGSDGIGGEGGVPVVIDSGETPEACDISTMRCTGRQVEFCTETGWVAAGGQCEFGCVAGACSGICVPGTTRCESGGLKMQTCDDAGEWGEPEICEFACVGDVEEGACGGVCLPATTGCGTAYFDPEDVFADEDLLLCGADGQWALQQTCPGYCTPTEGRVSTGVCGGECSNGSQQCITSTGQAAVETCVAPSEWGDVPPNTVELCGAGIPCSDAECGECVPGTQECIGSPGAPVSRTCDPFGQWPVGELCTFACVNGACAECEPGARRCGMRPKGPVIELCDEKGTWIIAEGGDCYNDEKRPNCVMIEEQPICAQCNPNAHRCSFTTPQTCNPDGFWEKSAEDCASSSQWCEAGGCINPAFECMQEFPAGPTGCFDEREGWICASVGNKPKIVGCDCTNGQGCQPIQ